MAEIWAIEQEVNVRAKDDEPARLAAIRKQLQEKGITPIAAIREARRIEAGMNPDH